MRIRVTSPACVLLILPFVSLLPATSMSQEFEPTPTLQASKILPPSMVRGKYHTVAELVRNDGVMNRYTLRTPQGALVVVGTDRLDKRIGEIAALQQMEKVKRSKIFGDAPASCRFRPLYPREPTFEPQQ